MFLQFTNINSMLKPLQKYVLCFLPSFLMRIWTWNIMHLSLYTTKKLQVINAPGDLFCLEFHLSFMMGNFNGYILLDVFVCSLVTVLKGFQKDIFHILFVHYYALHRVCSCEYIENPYKT